MDRFSATDCNEYGNAKPIQSQITNLDSDSARLEERDGRLLVVIPMQLKRRGGRKEIILPSGSGIGNIPGPGEDSTSIQKPIVLALAKAHLWKELLEEGQFSTLAELADSLGLDRAYVGRTLNLTLLAPDIILAILDGHEPSGLSLEKLRKAIPMDWEEQRRWFE